MLGLLRTVMRLSLKIILAISYVVIFILAFAAPQSFVGIAFDSGGATTGPMTVPFIMALGIGVSSARLSSKGGSSDSQSDNFGLTGMASVGPIMAVLFYGLILSHHASVVSETAAALAGGKAVQGLRAFTAVLLCCPLARLALGCRIHEGVQRVLFAFFALVRICCC